MPFYLVALNSVNSDPKTFSESAIQDPENIRATFEEKYPPEILYEEGDKEKFGPFVLLRKGVKRAEAAALERVVVTRFEENLIHDISIGLKREKVDDFVEHVIEQLQLKTKTEVRSTLEMMVLSDSRKSAMETSRINQGRFSSMYGFLGSVRSEDDTLTVIYALHKLEFSFPEGCFTDQEIAAIKNHYGKKKALVALQQQNVIRTIRYV